MLRLRETGSFKMKLSKKTIKISEKWIKIIEEPETIIKINHENLLWIACSNDQCKIQGSFKKYVKWYPKKIKNIGKKAKYIKQILSDKTPITTVMTIKIGKSEIPALVTQNTENMMTISFANL